MLGLGLSVDYSLLLVQRFREEKAPGRSDAQAIERTVASAGRTVTFSGLTVMACLAALLAFDEPTYRSLAIGGMAVVLVAVLAGTTLVPALLAVAAKRIRPQPPTTSDDGRFARLGGWVQRRPLAVALAVSGLLVASAVPFLGAHFHSRDNREIPRGSGARIVADAQQDRFIGSSGADPITVVLPEPSEDARVAAYVGQVRTWPGVADVAVERGLSGRWSALDVQPRGTTEGVVARSLVRELRAHRPVGGSMVTGDAAYTADSLARVRSGLPLALGIVVLASFLLLFLLTGSLVVPLKALVLSTLSLGATFGALKLVFQDGHLANLLGFDASGALDTDIPLIVFVFAFGLSMDYEVFLLARIKEAYDHGADNDTAVRLGLQRSGRIITCAAALITLVFAGFASGRTVPTKEIGTGLALAVIVDATLVRCLLLPATMTLLGRLNWWAPARLRAFALSHHLGEEELDRPPPDEPVADLVPVPTPIA
jgi:RND superfamily putative drug exporter